MLNNYINVSTSEEKYPTYITTPNMKLEIFSDRHNDRNCENLNKIYIDCVKDHKNLVDLQCNKIVKLLNSFNCERPKKII